MLTSLISRLLGFLRIGIISFIFGASVEADVIHSVFSIPNNLRKLLSEGALSAAFIPVISQSLIADPSRRESSKIIKNLLTLQFLILAPFLLLSTIFPEFVMRTFLNFSDPETLKLARSLFRYLIYYILFVSFSAVIMGALNSNDEFTIPGFTPIIFSLSVIGSLLIFHRQLGIFAMAVGVLVGGLGQILFQLPKFSKLGYRFTFNFTFNNARFRQILRNWGPILCSSAIFAVNQQIAYRFASAMESGSTTALSNAIVFWQLPYGIFSASIITVLFPKMSSQIAAGRRQDTARTIEFGISAIMTFLIPASAAMMLMAPELISTALQRGAFTVTDTIFSAEVLFWYSPGLVFVGINMFLQRLHFSSNETRIPVINALIITVLDVFLSLWLKETVLRVRGLALANTLSYAGATIWLFYQTKKRFPDFYFWPVLRNLLKIIPAILPGIFIILSGKSLFGDYWMSGSSLENLARFLAVAVPAAGSIILMFAVFRLETLYIFIKKGPQKNDHNK